MADEQDFLSTKQAAMEDAPLAESPSEEEYQDAEAAMPPDEQGAAKKPRAAEPHFPPTVGVPAAAGLVTATVTNQLGNTHKDGPLYQWCNRQSHMDVQAMGMDMLQARLSPSKIKKEEINN